MTNLSRISNDTFIGKLLIAPLRLIPRTVVVPILQGPLRRKKWIVGSALNGFWLGSFEYHKQKELQKELKAGEVVYDIGANVGFYTLLASGLVGETGLVYSFEPLPNKLRVLRKHLELNRVRNCKVIEAAVSSTDGQAAVDISGNHFMGHLSENGSLNVRTLTLDRLILSDGIRQLNLMKIDIEGAEYECLRGASDLIQKFHPVIFLATHGPQAHNACLELLAKWNYRFKFLDPRPIEESDELAAYPADQIG